MFDWITFIHFNLNVQNASQTKSLIVIYECSVLVQVFRGKSIVAWLLSRISFWAIPLESKQVPLIFYIEVWNVVANIDVVYQPTYKTSTKYK